MEQDTGGWIWIPAEPPTLLRLLTPQFDGTTVLPALAVVALAAYLLGVRRVRAAGSRWPWYRTALFALGIGTVVLATATQVMGYGMVLFSVHMFQHMVLMVLAPMLMMLGAPVTLALAALPQRGRVAVLRRLLVRAGRSRAARLIAHPVVSSALFLSSLYVFYFSSLLDLLMKSVAGNLFMLVFYLFVGVLAFGGAFGVDPWPHRASHPVRIVELALPGPLEAFFAVAVMTASAPLTRTFAEAPAGWGIDVLRDQLAAGNIVWGFGEIPSIIAFAIVFVSWVRSEERRARTLDLEVEAERAAYNARLAWMADRAPR